jgi:hypothetical protein
VASAMYNKAKNIATGKTDLEVSYATVGGFSSLVSSTWLLLNWYEHLFQM